MSEPIVRLKKRTPLVSLSRERFAALQEEVKLLREAYDALISMDHYDATKYNPRSAAAIAALEAFDSTRDKETT